jgi:hypothetical protein
MLQQYGVAGSALNRRDQLGGGEHVSPSEAWVMEDADAKAPSDT